MNAEYRNLALLLPKMDFKTFLENLNEEITCSICQETFGQPKMLPCLHTICLNCLNDMAQREIQHNRDAIRCPICNNNIPIPQPHGNFNSLPNNFYIGRLMDIVAVREAANDHDTMCGNCEERAREASYCFDCCTFWCSKCEPGHNIVREYRGHRLLALKDFGDDDLGAMLRRPAFCQQQHHKNKFLEYYCNDCEVCICQMCVVLEHKTHHVQPMEEVAGACEATVVEQVAKAKAKFQELLKSKEKVEERKNLVQKNLETVKTDIHNTVEGIIVNLRGQERELVAEMEELAAKSQAPLNMQNNEIASHIEKLQNVTKVGEGLVQRKSTLEILASKDGLHKRFNQLNQVKLEINPEVFVEGRFIPSEAVSTLKLGRLEKTVYSGKSTVKRKTKFVGIPTSGKKVSSVEIKESDVGSCASRSSVFHAGPREFVPVKVIGKKGRGNGEFNDPYSVAVNFELNEMAVTEAMNCRVQIFDRDGNYLRQFGQKGSGQGMFKGPVGIVYDKHNNIVVSDHYNHTVSVFTKEGTFLRNLATEGNKDGQVKQPIALSVTDEGNIIVTDDWNKIIQVFTPDGRLVLRFGDTGNGKLQDPVACVYHRDHYIVTDLYGECIKLYDKRGQYVKTLTLQQGNEREPIADIWPRGITSTNCGNIIVTDAKKHRLVMFSLDGSVIATVGSKGSGLGRFNWPSDVSILGDKVIIVCNHDNHQLQVLQHP